MKHAKHTPGPWTVGISIDSKYDWPVFRLSELKNPSDQTELAANARLIAAAPELLELLTKISKAVSCNGDFGSEINLRGDEVQEVFQAIRRATGGVE